jgi:acyl-CoA synthetase (NDP forming)
LNQLLKLSSVDNTGGTAFLILDKLPLFGRILVEAKEWNPKSLQGKEVARFKTIFSVNCRPYK